MRQGETEAREASVSCTQIGAVHSSEDYHTDPVVWDLVIVGAGIAGSALAAIQAKEGRRILLLERDLSQPDRIVGELLQPGGYLKLKALGLDDCVDNIDSQKVYGYCIIKDGQQAKIRYPKDGAVGEVSGRSFHNGRFVQKLRQAASQLSNVTVRQAIAKRLLNEHGEEWEDGEAVQGVLYKDREGREQIARAHLTIVCDGMYSNLRSKLSQPKIKHPSFFVGLLLKGCSLPHANFGHVILAKPSPILFYPISSHEVRCLVDVPGEKLPSSLPQYLTEQVGPQIPEGMRQSFLDAVDSGNIRSMQNKLMPAAPLHRPGALLLGDAFNMRHPLTGGGMTVALSDTQLLTDMLRPLHSFQDAVVTANTTSRFYTLRKPVSATINTLANALYQVFCYTGDRAHEEMQKACFDYLRLGGWYSEGPISLLSGLRPNPSILVMHFFAVAVFGVGRLLLPRPTFRGLWLGILLLYCATGIIVPIIKAEGLRAVFAPYLVSKPSTKISSQRGPSSKPRGKGFRSGAESVGINVNTTFHNIEAIKAR